MNSAQKTIKICAITLAILIIIGIFQTLLFVISSFLNVGFSSANESFTERFQNLEKIDIDLGASDLIIESGNEFKIEADQVSKNFSAKEKNGTLKIVEHGNWFFRTKSAGKITITVPKNTKLNSLKIDAGAGKINISDLTSTYLDIDQGAGVLKITNSVFDETDIDGGAGLLEITNSTLRNLDLDVGVGKTIIEGNVFGFSKIDGGVGELNLNFKRESDYTITLEKGIGSITVDGNETKEKIIGTGRNKIDIDGGVGSIKINFES